MASNSVLLIEDSLEVRDVVSEILFCYGYDVIVAENGQEAWEKVNTRAIDLVITDMGLPDMDGEEFYRKMRRNSIKTPVLFTTGVDMNKSHIKWDDFSNYRLLLKPFNISEIKTAISELLENKSHK